MAEVKRYDPEDEAEMFENRGGEYMTFESHTAIVAALERRLRIAERALELVDEQMEATGSPDTWKQRAEREIDAEQKEQENG